MLASRSLSHSIASDAAPRNRPGRSASAISNRARRGFSLAEAIVALTLTAIAGSVLLLATESSVRTATDGVERSIAQGMANQIVDEVLGGRYKEAGVSPYQYPVGPGADELLGGGRELFDDTDDYNNFTAEGAEDIWGQPLGAGDNAGGLRHSHFRLRDGYFSDWRQEIQINYVDDDDPSVDLSLGQTSNHRAVEVRIYKRQPDGVLKPLAQVRRVYAYVPPP